MLTATGGVHHTSKDPAAPDARMEQNAPISYSHQAPGKEETPHAKTRLSELWNNTSSLSESAEAVDGPI